MVCGAAPLFFFFSPSLPPPPFSVFCRCSLYNLTCVLLAGAVCYGIIEHIIKYRSIAFVGNTKYLDARTEAGAHFNFFMWLYYIQK